MSGIKVPGWDRRVISRALRASAILGSAVLLSGVAHADSNVTAAISSINIYRGSDAQVANIFFSSALQHPEGCTYGPDNVIRIEFSSAAEPSGKTLYATVLAAFHSGKNIEFGVRGCDTTGAIPVVYSVRVFQ